MRIVVYGAGQIGRGLIGKIFCNDGHRVVFVEKQMEVTRRLQMNSYYPLQTGKGLEWVGPVVAVMPGGETEELNSADLIICCVRVENMDDVAVSLVNSFIGRPKDAKRVDVLVVENMPHADLYLSNLVKQNANETLNNVFFSMGIAECVIPEVDPDVQLLDPALMNTDTKGFLIVPRELDKLIGDVYSIYTSSNFEFDWALKWFCHCALHSVIAYVGIAQGYTYVDEVLADSDFKRDLTDLFRQIRLGLSERFSDSRFANMKVESRLFEELDSLQDPPIRDTLSRVARDAARKVSEGERLRDLEKLVGENKLVTEAISQAEKMS